MAGDEKRERRGPGERWEPLMALWRLEDGQEFRDCWLVSTRSAAEVMGLLEGLSARLPRGYAGALEVDDLSETEISDEARRACERAGDVTVMFALEGAGKEDAGSLWPLREALEGLKGAGLALGPARLSTREDHRIFELDAALACLAMRERARMERDAQAAKPKGARRGKGPNARL